MAKPKYIARLKSADGLTIQLEIPSLVRRIVRPCRWPIRNAVGFTSDVPLEAPAIRYSQREYELNHVQTLDEIQYCFYEEMQ